MDVGLDALLHLGSEFNLFVEERRVEPEVDLDVAILLVGRIVKLGAVGDELYFLGSQFPGLVQVAFLDRRPKVPEDFEFVGVVFVQEFLGQCQSALRIGAVVEGLFEEQGLIPRDAVYREISDSILLGGERELLQQGD